MFNKSKIKAVESVKLLLLALACAAATSLSACVDKDRDVPANPQSIIAGSDSSPAISKINAQGKVAKSGPANPDSVAIKP